MVLGFLNFKGPKLSQMHFSNVFSNGHTVSELPRNGKSPSLNFQCVLKFSKCVLIHAVLETNPL